VRKSISKGPKRAVESVEFCGTELYGGMSTSLPPFMDAQCLRPGFSLSARSA